MRISIIGIGNTLMGDDGVGVHVAERLAADLGDLPDASVFIGNTAGMALMPHIMSADAVYFIDALACGASPGSIYRLDPDEAGVTKTRSDTSHGIGIPYLVTSARLQGHFPTFVVYGIQVGDTMCGPDTLTEEVRSAADRVLRMLAEEVRRILAGDTAPVSRRAHS